MLRGAGAGGRGHWSRPGLPATHNGVVVAVGDGWSLPSLPTTHAGGSYFGEIPGKVGGVSPQGDVQHGANGAGKVDGVSELASTSTGPEGLKEGKKNGPYQHLHSYTTFPWILAPLAHVLKSINLLLK